MKITFRNVNELTTALKAAQAEHHKLEEQQVFTADHDWAEWYAMYMMEHGTYNN